FFFRAPASSLISSLSLHDALPISRRGARPAARWPVGLLALRVAPDDAVLRLRCGLDDDERVAVRVAEPEHRRNRPAPARDLVVEVDAGGFQGCVIGVDV